VLEDVVAGVAAFNTWGHSERIRLFAWFLHTREAKERFQTADINRCFDVLHLARPSNASQLITQLTDQGHFLKDGAGWRLGREQRDKLDQNYGRRQETVAVDKLLSELPGRMTDNACREYLEEALVCFRHAAFRAAIVMTWNVTYGHLLTVVVARNLSRFNVQMSTMFGGKKKPINSIDDFQKLKESEVIEVCNAGGLISKEVSKVLADKLDKRNTAAHPSGATVDKLQAEAFISDLVKNALLKFA
jgi:hypothetical protein